MSECAWKVLQCFRVDPHNYDPPENPTTTTATTNLLYTKTDVNKTISIQTKRFPELLKTFEIDIFWLDPVQLTYDTWLFVFSTHTTNCSFGSSPLKL